jgi:hypothetical protein
VNFLHIKIVYTTFAINERPYLDDTNRLAAHGQYWAVSSRGRIVTHGKLSGDSKFDQFVHPTQPQLSWGVGFAASPQQPHRLAACTQKSLQACSLKSLQHKMMQWLSASVQTVAAEAHGVLQLIRTKAPYVFLLDQFRHSRIRVWSAETVHGDGESS